MGLSGSETEIRNMVRRRYATLAPTESCCGVGGENVAAPEIVKAYASAELEGLPSDVLNGSLGCGNPIAWMEAREGDTVLDIGSGTGLDCFLAARQVSARGRVIGLDMTSEMVEAARRRAAGSGLANVEFRLGKAEAIPIQDASVDWIISNCVVNLSPNKQQVFKEWVRVLKPGGQIAVSDVVLGRPLPKWAVKVDLWTGCIAGAALEEDFLEGLKKAGLVDVRVASRNSFSAVEAQSCTVSCCSGESQLNESQKSELADGLWAALFRARKP